MEAKADQLMEEGEKKLKGGGLMSFLTSDEERFEKAREKFLAAATQYKAAGNFLRAASAYQRAGDMSSKTNCESDFVSDCEEAAKMFHKANDGRATELFMRVVDMFDKNQKYTQAAKYCVQIADTLSGREAISWLEKGIRYYKSERSPATATELVKKIADIHVKSGNYDEAKSVYERMGREALDDRLSRGSARKLFFAALLCQLASITGTNLSEGITELQERFAEYQDADPQFNEHTREHMLIKALIEAMEEQDIEKFEAAVDDHDQVCPLDPQQQKMLLRAKSVLRNADVR